MRALRAALLWAMLATTVSACGESPTDGSGTVRLDYDFHEGWQGWSGHFAEYPVGEEDFYGLEAGHATLPHPLPAARQAVFLSGNNHSDDLFMFLRRPIAGLRPNTRYRVSWTIEIATDAPAGCVGVGGAPGESVYLKAGISRDEPRVVAVDGYYEVTVDKGNQAAGGADAIVLGHVANDNRDCFNPVYQLRTISSKPNALRFTTDAQGGGWLLVGTDSGFEARTRIYYTKIRVTLTPA
jgi:hypothetical protein